MKCELEEDDLLRDAWTAVAAGDILTLRNLAPELVSVKHDTLYCHPDNPWWGKDPILTACKVGNPDVLEYLLKDGCKLATLLGWSGVGGAKGQDAVYHAVRSGNIQLIENLEAGWPGSLEPLLARAYRDILLKNIPLPEEIINYIHSKLVEFRFYKKISSKNISANILEERITVLLQNINELQNFRDDTVDEKFLHVMKFVAKDINMLKQQLKSTYDRIPWEEMEFTLVIFVKMQSDDYDNKIFFLSILNKLKVLEYLKCFAELLKELFEDIIKLEGFEKDSYVSTLKAYTKLKRDEVILLITEKYSVFLDLYNDYHVIRDIHSLDRMKQVMDEAVSVKIEQREGRLVVHRALQVVGEHLKNTLDSPYLSDATSIRLLLPSLPEIIQILTEVRNSLVHIHYADYEINKDHIKLYHNIQNDFKKLSLLIVEILYSEKLKCIKNTLMTLVDSDDFSEFLLSNKHIKLNPSCIHIDQMPNEQQKLEQMVSEISNEIPDKTMYEEELLKKINELIQRSQESLKKTVKSFSAGIELLTFIFSDQFITQMKDNNSIREIKHLVKNILHGFVPGAAPTIEVHDTDILINLFNSLIKNIQPKISTNFSIKYQQLRGKITGNFHFDKNAVMWIEKFGEQMLKHAPKKSKKRRKPIVTGDHQLRQEKKISELRDILSKYEMTPVATNKPNKAMIEMLVLDIMSDMVDSDCLEGDSFFLDDDVPFLVAKNLRNYLAHGNPVAELLCPETWAATLANAKFLTKKPIDKKYILICENEKPISKPDTGLQIIEKQTEMVEALEGGDMELLNKYIGEGADLKSRNLYFSTVWHHAARLSNLEMLHFIWNENNSVSGKDTMKRTPLHIAATFGNTNMIYFLADKAKADVGSIDVFGKTPLHLAAEYGHKDSINALLGLGAETGAKDIHGEVALCLAVRNNHMSVVQALIKSDSSVEGDRSISKNTYLTIAAENGNMELLKYFLHNNEDVNTPNSGGWRPLHLASKNTSGEIVKIILENGALPNLRVPWSGDTSLHLSAENGREDIVKVLLKNGAAVNVQNKNNSTPLHKASIKGFKSIVNILIDNGANVNALDDNNTTPIMYASRGGHTEIVLALAQMGASLEYADKDKLTVLHFIAMAGYTDITRSLIKKIKVIDCRDYENSTPLHLAALYGKIEVIDLLVAAGADIHAEGKNGETPLHYSVRSGQASVTQHLLKLKANPNSITVNGVTPLAIAAFLGDHNIAQVLMEGGTYVDQYEKFNRTSALENLNENPISKLVLNKQENSSLETVLNQDYKKIIKNLTANTLNENKLTALHLAAELGHINIVEQLLKKDAVLDISDPLTNKPLHLASRNGHQEIVAALLRAGASVDSHGHLKYTALHNAARKGHYQIVQLLIQAGAQLDAQTEDGNTALHLATMGNYKEVVNLLLKNNLDVNILNKAGLSALLTAIRLDYKDIVHILINKGADININKGYPLMVAIFAGKKSVTKILLNCKEIDLTVTDNTAYGFLHTAVMAGNWNAGKLLCAKGVHVDAPGENNRTPLHNAAFKGNKEFVQMLLENGANVHAVDNDNHTPLSEAIGAGCLQSVKLLLRYGSKLPTLPFSLEAAVHMQRQDIVELLVDHFKNEINKEFILTTAVTVGNLDAVKLMVNKGADYSIKEEIGVTPIQKAAYLGYTHIVEYFLNRGVKSDIIDNGGRTLLHYAVQNGKGIQYLINREVNVNTPDKNNQLPLHYACYSGRVDTVRELLQHGSFYSTIDTSGKNPIQCAVGKQAILDQLVDVVNLFMSVQENDVDKIESLVRTGTPVNARSKDNWTPLLYSVWKGNAEACHILLKGKANPDYTGKGGNSPLHLAAYFSQLEIVKLLLTNGAIYNILNWKEKTPLDLTILKDIKDILILVDDTFIKVVNGNKEIMNELKRINDDTIIKAIIRARNKEGKSLVVVAMQNDFLQTEELKNILQGNNLTVALKMIQQRDYTKALELLSVVLNERILLFGEDNPGTLDVLAITAKVYSEQHKYSQALELLEGISEKESKIFGSFSKFHLLTRTSIAEVLMKQSKHQQAYNILQEIYYQHITRREPHTEMQTGCLLAETLCSLGKYDNAFMVSDETYKMCFRTLGAKDENTRSAQLTKANVLARQNKDAEALRIYREVQSTWRGVLGPNTNHTHQSMRYMAEIISKQGKYEEALLLYRELLALQRSGLGASHADTMITEKHVANLILMKYKRNNKMTKHFKNTEDTAKELELNHPYNLYLNRKKKQKSEIIEEDIVEQDYDKEMICSAKKGDTGHVTQLAKQGHDVNTIDGDRRTPLYHAASGGHTSTVAALLHYGADIEEITADGDNVLHAAACYTDILKLLLQKKVDFTNFINIPRLLDGATALHIAVSRGSAEAVNYLLANGAKRDLRDKQGHTARDMASQELLITLAALHGETFDL